MSTDYTYRIRVGEYRVVYSLHESALIIEVVRVGHRKEVSGSLPDTALHRSAPSVAPGEDAVPFVDRHPTRACFVGRHVVIFVEWNIGSHAKATYGNRA